MQWLLTSHVRRYHKHYGSSGHIWQGRFKSFAVQRDEHLITTLRYVLQNPVRAGLSETVHEWPWSSARRRQLVDRSPVDEEIRWSEQLESRLRGIAGGDYTRVLESATTVWSIGMANGNGGDVRTWEYIAPARPAAE